ncbi:helix-turn-helix domain-containing protein [bacterium]|nr:helix-turn-helix domain-containing protein [bacterium]
MGDSELKSPVESIPLTGAFFIIPVRINYQDIMNLVGLGIRIRKLRESMNLSQLQLANSLHISPQAVSKWERGMNAPDLSVLPLLSTVLQVSLDTLLRDGVPVQSTFPGVVLASSVRGFAQRAATLFPDEVAVILNGMFHSITRVILNYSGVPVKYLGDGFLAYFSGFNYVQRAWDAAIQLNRLELLPGLTVSLQQGPIYLGRIGYGDYAQLDVIGDTVNHAFLLNQWAATHNIGVAAVIDSTINNGIARRRDAIIQNRTLSVITLEPAEHPVQQLHLPPDE